MNFAAVIVLLTFTVSNVYSGLVYPQPRDLFDAAEALLEDLRATVENGVNSAVSQLNLLTVKMKAAADAVLAPAELAIVEETNIVKEKVNDLRQEAEEQGADLAKLEQCILTYSYQIDQLPTYVLREIGACINGTVHRGEEIIKDSIKQIQSTTANTVQYLKLQIAECRLLPDNTQCILRVIEAISVEFVNLPATIKDDIARNKAVIVAFDSTFQSCASDRVPVIQTMGNQIIAYIKSCANLNL